MALSDGLVGCWSPWLGASGYQLLDRSGRGFHAQSGNYDGTEYEGVTVQGKSGRAVRHGSPFTKFLNCGNVPVNIDNKPFAVSCWFKSNVMQGQILVAKSLFGAGPNRWWIGLTATGITAGTPAPSNGANEVFSTLNYDDGKFHHLMATYYGTTMRLYYDGIFKVSSGGVQLGGNTNSLLFGRYNDASGGATQNNSSLNGWIAEICCWQSRMQDESIWQLYQLGPGWYQPKRRRPVGYVPASSTNRRRRILIGASS